MAVIDNLRMSKVAMLEAIHRFETKKMGLEIMYLKISNEVRELDGTWHGEASEKFKAQFEELYKNLKQNEEVMSNVVATLKAALATYERGEAAAQAIIRGLDDGVAYSSDHL